MTKLIRTSIRRPIRPAHPIRRLIGRREFLSRSAGIAGATALGASVPSVFCKAAEAAGEKGDQRVLVVIEMAGGNDGLNCVVPHSDPVYKRSRDALRIAKSDTLAINHQLGFHGSLRGFADLLEQGQLAIVQGVGYPNPNRSHFESMDIWHTCKRKDEVRPDGWVGRYLEHAASDTASDPPALHLGGEKQPFALMSRDVRVPSIQDLKQFRLQENKSVDVRTVMQDLSTPTSDVANDLLSFVQSSTSNAVMASERMEAANKSPRLEGSFPSSGLGQKLQTVAKLIAADMETRIYYLRIDGFDTHANQPAAHAALLREVSEGVSSFMKEMNRRGESDRVLVMCFSEFGRRVAENASEGTDHGTAGPVFFAGNQVRAGLIGDLPSLTDLENGDLKFHTDFRGVYATILENWFQTPSESILAKRFETVDLLRV